MKYLKVRYPKSKQKWREKDYLFIRQINDDYDIIKLVIHHLDLNLTDLDQFRPI